MTERTTQHGAAPPAPPASALVVTARALGVDALTVKLVRAFRAEGCRAILLRGPVVRRRLYADGSPRGYGDVDLLVAPADIASAGEILGSLGFELGLDHDEHPGTTEPHAHEWGRPGESRTVDLHWRIPGIDAPAESAWEILSAHAEPMMLGGESAESLRKEGVALVVVLHAAYHGRAHAKSVGDLERALEYLDGDTWASAARLAAELDATEAFAAGLRLVPAGERLASALELPEVRSRERMLRAGDQPAGSLSLLRIMQQATVRGRLRVLRYALLPSRAYMRALSPLAARGRVGLMLAYLGRLWRRMLELPTAIRAVRASRLPGPPSVSRLVSASVRLAWAAGRREVTAMGTTLVVGIVAVVVGLLFTRSLLAALLHADRAGDDAGKLTLQVVGVAVSLAAGGIANAVHLQRQRVLAELCTRRAEDELLAVTTGVALAEFDSAGFHDSMARALLAVRRLPTVVTGLAGLMRALATATGALLVLVAVQPLFAPGMLLVALPTVIAARRGARLFHQIAHEMIPRDRRRHYLAELLADRDTAKEVRAYDLGPFLADRRGRLWDERLRELRRNASRQLRYSALAAVTASGLVAAALLAVIALTLSGDGSLADAGVAVAAVVVLGQRLGAAASNAGGLSEATVFMGDYLALSERGAGAAGTDDAPLSASNPVSRCVRAEGVTFAYPGARGPALREVSLEIAPGEVVALVGENGSGKTTLAKLLAGLYAPTAGRVTWDGVDAASDEGRRLSAGMSVIFQDFVRYALPASENVGVGRHERLPDDAGVHSAAEAAGIHDVLSRLADGYATILGPAFAGGTDLSLGQWQRVALARALFREAPFVILDEPTAALDAQAEHDLFERLRTVFAGRGVLLISHRFSTVREADRIHVLDAGSIVESGTHGELLERDGRYAKLFSLQAASYR